MLLRAKLQNGQCGVQTLWTALAASGWHIRGLESRRLRFSGGLSADASRWAASSSAICSAKMQRHSKTTTLTRQTSRVSLFCYFVSTSFLHETLGTRCRQHSWPSDTLLQSGDWHETSYDWATLSIAQQLRTKLAAASQKRVLFLIVAADFPKHHVPRDIFRRMQAAPSMTATKKLMGVLPLFHGAIVRLTRTILPPELVPEREGKIIGIELNEADHKIFAATPIFSEGAFTPQYLPRTIWVQFDDLSWELIDPMPCSQHQILGADRACNACRFFRGVVGITPVEAHWTFKEKLVGQDFHLSMLMCEEFNFPLLQLCLKPFMHFKGKRVSPDLCAMWPCQKNFLRKLGG